MLTAVSTIEPLTHSMCGRITRNTVESTNREPSVDVGTISREIRIFREVAFSCGLNLIVTEFQDAVKSCLDDSL